MNALQAIRQRVLVPLAAGSLMLALVGCGTDEHQEQTPGATRVLTEQDLSRDHPKPGDTPRTVEPVATGEMTGPESGDEPNDKPTGDGTMTPGVPDEGRANGNDPPAEEKEKPAPGERTGSFSKISAGSHHACGVDTDGVTICWGNNAMGQATPDDAEYYSSISAGESHTCGVKPDATVSCWGRNDYGQSQPPSPSTALVATLDTGYLHTCAVLIDGSLSCWGRDWHSQLDHPPGKFDQVSAGYQHSCAVRTVDGAALCWGNPDSGRTAAPEGPFRSVAVGDAHACGVMLDRSISCWGEDEHGQDLAPTGNNFASVSTGYDHSCGLRRDGKIECWGSNGFGQADAPEGLFAQLSAGGRQACAITGTKKSSIGREQAMPDGAVICWGEREPSHPALPGS